MGNKKDSISLYVFIGVLLLFSLLQFPGLSVEADGDENVYYFMGKLVADGNMPYRDFFYAHPPVQLILFALLYKVFGFNLFVFKLVPLLSIIISAIFLYLIVKHKFDSVKAVVAVVLFLFSFVILFNSVNAFGANLALMVLAAGYFVLEVKKKPFLAGIIFGIAGLTRLYALIPIAIILGYYFFTKRKQFFKLLVGFLSVFGTVQLLLVLFLGSAYLNPTIQYHFAKTDSMEKAPILAEVLKLNMPLFVSALLVILFFKKRELQIPIFTSIIYILFIVLQPRVFPYYFVPLFFFLAILGSFAIVTLYNKINKKARLILTVIIVALFLWNTTADTLFLQKIKFGEFNTPNEMVDFLEEYGPEEIVGDSIVPLLALKSEQKVSQNIVDLNEQVFQTGIIAPDEFSEKIRNKEFDLVIINSGGLALQLEIRDTLQNTCPVIKTFQDRLWAQYAIFDCRR